MLENIKAIKEVGGRTVFIEGDVVLIKKKDRTEVTGRIVTIEDVRVCVDSSAQYESNVEWIVTSTIEEMIRCIEQ